MTKTPSIKHTSQIPLRGKTVQHFIGPPDRHAAFTTSLHLDTSFAMTPCVLWDGHPAAPNVPPVLWPKPANLPPAMSTRVRPPQSTTTPSRSFALPPHGQPTQTRHLLPP